jgi:hypothetical protein
MKTNSKNILCTQNYTEHWAVVSQLNIADIVKAVDYINLLKQFINKENEVLDNLHDILFPFNNVIDILQADELCRRQDCCSYLFKSDLPQYDFVCPACGEYF